MTFSRADMDFVQGFVKQAHAMGLDEDTTTVMLSVAFPRWKDSTEGTLGLKKSAGGLGTAFRTLGHGLLSTGKGLAGVAGHGTVGAAKGLWSGAKGVGGAVKNHPVAALGLGATAGAGAGGYGLYNMMHRKDGFLDPNGYPGGVGAPGSTGGGSGDGTYQQSQYSPHGAFIQAKLNDYSDDGAMETSGTPATSTAAPAGTQWDQAVRSTQSEVKAHQNKVNELNNRLRTLSSSGLDPAAQEMERQRLTGLLGSENSAISAQMKNLGKQDETLRTQEDQYQQAKTTNQATIARELSSANQNASTFAQRSRQAANASWWLPKAYYGARNYFTGDTPEYGSQISQRIQALENARNGIQSQPQHYYHNSP